MRNQRLTWLPLPVVIVVLERGHFSQKLSGHASQLHCSELRSPCFSSVGWSEATYRASHGYGAPRERSSQLKRSKSSAPSGIASMTLVLPYGNWDHVLVGPPGVFMPRSESATKRVGGGGRRAPAPAVFGIPVADSDHQRSRSMTRLSRCSKDRDACKPLSWFGVSSPGTS
jgi:hypothetical protein